MYIIDESDEAKEFLAGQLGRTIEAVSLIYAWIKRGNKLPKRARNRIWSQVKTVRSKLGSSKEGIIKIA